MRLQLLFFAWLCIFTGGCAKTPRVGTSVPSTQEPFEIRTEELALYDYSRDRAVPVLLYHALAQTNASAKRKLAILNHGYGGKNSAYSFIAHHLVAQGYMVASIQHELPSDPPMPLTGNVYEVRMPHWQRGVQNILFVLQELKKTRPAVDVDQLLLIGHSNGGDMVMLFAQQYPAQVQKIISLDNRRVPLPRASRPQVLTLRSSDQLADAGVLPTPTEQATFGTVVINLPATIHNDMWNGATAQQKEEMLHHISQFLRK